MEHMLAIVTISGKQYKVSKGDIISVDRMDGNVGDIVEFDHVLLTQEKDAVKVGAPTVKGVSVKAKILAQEKGEKLEIRRYKSKVRYRRHRGFRASLTKLEITVVA
jgi:large subunit ribosomal protein L21